MKKYDVLSVDFDGTLHDSSGVSGLGRDIRVIFNQFGVDSPAVEHTMKRALYGENGKSYTYTFEKHLAMLEREYGYHFDDEILYALKNLVVENKYLFSDAVTFLDYAKQISKKLTIVSAANPEFQLMKIRATHIENKFDEIYFTDYDKTKKLNEYASEGARVLYINDSLKENEDILKYCPGVSVITKYRPEKYTLEQVEAVGVPFFKTLTEIQNYVAKKFTS